MNDTGVIDRTLGEGTGMIGRTLVEDTEDRSDMKDNARTNMSYRIDID